LVRLDQNRNGDPSMQIAAEAAPDKGPHGLAFGEDVLRRHQQVRSKHARRARKNLAPRLIAHDPPRARHQLFRFVGRKRDAELGLALAEIPAPVDELPTSFLGVDKDPMEQ